MKDTCIYYIRGQRTLGVNEEESRIVATVALVRCPGQMREAGGKARDAWCRGVAVVGDGDQPCKKIGRTVALGRANKAAREGQSSCESRGIMWNNDVPRGLFRVYQELELPWLPRAAVAEPKMHKARFDVALTPFERKLVGVEP